LEVCWALKRLRVLVARERVVRVRRRERREKSERGNRGRRGWDILVWGFGDEGTRRC
jgi:hypothetical protein